MPLNLIPFMHFNMRSVLFFKSKRIKISTNGTCSPQKKAISQHYFFQSHTHYTLVSGNKNEIKDFSFSYSVP